MMHSGSFDGGWIRERGETTDEAMKELLRYAHRDAGRLAKEAIVTTHVRFGLGVICAVIALLLDAPLRWLVTIEIVTIGLALHHTINQWGSRSHIMATYLSDLALKLHELQVDVIAGATEGAVRHLDRQRVDPV